LISDLATKARTLAPPMDEVNSSEMRKNTEVPAHKIATSQKKNFSNSSQSKSAMKKFNFFLQEETSKEDFVKILSTLQNPKS
jgi:hypothetical protein